MAEFTYDAINAQGLLTSGSVSAPDLDSAREQLQSRGLLPSALSEKPAAGEAGMRQHVQGGQAEVAPDLRPPARDDDRGGRERRRRARHARGADRRQVPARGRRRGARRRRVGPRSSRGRWRGIRRCSAASSSSMVAAGESSGTLDTVLDRVATQIEKDTKLKRRVKSAMIYPLVVISFATLVLIFMLMFIVPVFQNVFAELNGQLPGADAGHHRPLAPPARLLVHHLPADRAHHLDAAAPEGNAGRDEALGPVQAARPDEDRRRRPQDRARARLAHARDARRCRRRHHQRARHRGRHGRQLGRRAVARSTRASACTTVCRSASR